MFNRPEKADKKFIAAIKAGNVDDVKRCLKSIMNRDQLNDVDENGTPLLLLALTYGHHEIANLILNRGANPSLTGSDGVTALMIAARSGNLEMVKKLVAMKAKTSAVCHGLNAVEIAAVNGHGNIVSLLLERGAYIQCQDLHQRLTNLGKFEMITLIEKILDERLNQLGINFFTLTPQLKSMILGLSKNNVERLTQVIEHLETSNQLTLKNLAAVLSVILKKNPAIKPQQYKTADDPNEADSIGDWKFYSEMKEKGSGGQAMIYHGFASAPAAMPQMPDFLLKAFTYELNKLREAQSRAMRETKYLNLAGRRAAVTFEHPQPLVITEWQRGESVDEIRKKYRLVDFPLHRRMKWLASALSDLDNLHANFRVHSDIKLLNLVLDINTDTMRLIDFGAAHKPDTTKSIMSSTRWMDPEEGWPQKMSGDMYMMGMVIGHIFPELFDVGKHKIPVIISRPNQPLNTKNMTSLYLTPLIEESNRTHAEHLIYTMVDAMQERMATMRCSSQQALACCKLMLEKIDRKTDEISAEDMIDILDATINRDYFTVDDALRDTRRPELFRIPDEIMAAAESSLSSERESGEKYSDSSSTYFQPTDKKKRKVDPDEPSSNEPKKSP